MAEKEVAKVPDVTGKLSAYVQDAKGITVVDFYAPWCMPCKAMEPEIAKLVKAHPKVNFAKVDIDKDDTATARYGVRSVPTFLIFRGGTVLDTIVGADKNGLKKAIERLT